MVVMQRRRRRHSAIDLSPARIALAIAIATLIGLTGCGGGRSDPAVVRVGGTSIGKRSVDHWSAMITRGALVARVADASEDSPNQQALALLINSRWLIGEAARNGLRPTRAQVRRLVDEQRETSGTRAQFAEMLAASGETLADVELEARARWAASALARRLASTLRERARAQVTGKAVAQFYRAHAARYHLRERRFYDLIERVPSRAQAAALARRADIARRFAEHSSKEDPFRPRNFRNLPGQAIVYKAVFATKKVGVIVGPLPLQGQWCLFVIRRIDPARVQPLSEVRRSIGRRLRAESERRVKAQLVSDYRARWLARTECHRGYVVQKCRQYVGPRRPEGEPFTGY